MSRRVATVMFVALAALLVAAGLTAAQSPSSPETAPQAGQSLPVKDTAAGYAVQSGTAAAGAYRLAAGESAGWSVRGATGGGSYRLDVVSAVRGTGTPCCCSFLPCVLKGYR